MHQKAMRNCFLSLTQIRAKIHTTEQSARIIRTLLCSGLIQAADQIRRLVCRIIDNDSTAVDPYRQAFPADPAIMQVMDLLPAINQPCKMINQHLAILFKNRRQHVRHRMLHILARQHKTIHSTL